MKTEDEGRNLTTGAPASAGSLGTARAYTYGMLANDPQGIKEMALLAGCDAPTPWYDVQTGWTARFTTDRAPAPSGESTTGALMRALAARRGWRLVREEVLAGPGGGEEESDEVPD